MASTGASLDGAESSYAAAQEAHRAHPSAVNERRLRAARHHLLLVRSHHDDAALKVQHQHHKADVEGRSDLNRDSTNVELTLFPTETARRLHNLDEHASEAERRETEHARKSNITSCAHS